MIEGLRKRLRRLFKGGAPEGVPPLDREAAARIRQALDVCMEQEKAYLDARLDLAALSRRIGTNRTYLSTCLNRTMGLSFSDYLNGLRVGEACRLLESPEARDLPMQEVAARCGFGSRASMDRAFRRRIGIPPAKYREIS